MDPLERLDLMQQEREKAMPMEGSPVRIEEMVFFNALMLGKLVAYSRNGCTDNEFRQLVDSCVQQTLERRQSNGSRQYK